VTEHGDGSPLSRRGFLGTAATVAVAGTAAAEDALAATSARPSTPDAALRALRAGNDRYRRGRWLRRDYSPVGERRASAQAPFAAILTCADSRIAPSLVFDVERGNLFGAHVAGNSVDSGSLGSLEYAVAVLEVPLIVVLGHTDCGAVKAAISVADGKATYPPEQYGAIGEVVGRIVPAVQALPVAGRTLAASIAANAAAQAKDLESRDPIIAPAVKAGRLRVVAAVYDIRTGRVGFS